MRNLLSKGCVLFFWSVVFALALLVSLVNIKARDLRHTLLVEWRKLFQR